MQALSMQKYVVLGAQLWHLRYVAPRVPVHEQDGESGLLVMIEQCREQVRELGLHVTERAADKIWEVQAELAELPPGARLTSEQAARLTRIAPHVWHTFTAETAGKVAYIASDKRYDVNRLLENVADLMAPSAFDRLPAMAKVDLQEAGICIAFQRPTAAAFHLMRAAEATLRHYYRSVVRRGRIAEPWLWAALVAHLRRRKTHAPPVELLDQLDAMRRNFRNPTQHPDKVDDIDEAQDLFAATIELVNRLTASPRWLPVSTEVTLQP
jgi:hypothetical protein